MKTLKKKPLARLKKKLNEKSKANNLLWILVIYFLILIYELFFNAKDGLYLIIPLVLFFVFYFSYRVAKNAFSKSELISSIIFLLVLGLGPFGIYDYSFFGVTGDVYIHLLAGFFATRWVMNLLIFMEIKQYKLISFLVMIFFSLGVEVYEVTTTYFFHPEKLNNNYLLDTLNDLLNDGLGILLGLIRTK